MVTTAAESRTKCDVVRFGPAGLTCAGEQVKKGHEITVCEALHIC